MRFSQLRIAILEVIACIAWMSSLLAKDEAPLLFLIGFLAFFAAGILYSISLHSRKYL